MASEFILKPERSTKKGKNAESSATRTRPKDTSGRLPRPASSLSPIMGIRSPPDRERSSSPPRERQKNVREEADAARNVEAAPAAPVKEAPAPIAAPSLPQKPSAGEKSMERRDRSGSPVSSRQRTGRQARKEDPSYAEWRERSVSPPRDRDRAPAAATDSTSARQKWTRARKQRALPMNEGRIALVSPSSPRSPQRQESRGAEDIPWLELPLAALGSPQRRGSGGNGSPMESSSRRGSAESKQIVESRPPWNWAFWSRGKGPASGPLSPPGSFSPTKVRGRSKSAESMQLASPEEEAWHWNETATSPRKRAPIAEAMLQPLLDRLTPGSAVEATVYSTEVETQFPKDAPPELVEKILEGAFGKLKEGRMFPQLEGGSQAQEEGGPAVAFEKPDIHFPAKGKDEAGEGLVSDAGGTGYRIDDVSENNMPLLRLPAVTKTEDRGRSMRTQYLTVAGVKGGPQPERAIQVKPVSAEEREVLKAVSHQMAVASQEKTRRRAAEDEAQMLREQVAALESRAVQMAAERKEDLKERKEGLEEEQKQLHQEKGRLRQKQLEVQGYEQQLQSRGQILVGQEQRMQQYEQQLQDRDDLLTGQEKRMREMQKDMSWLEQSILSGSAGKKAGTAAAEEKKRGLERNAEQSSKKIMELQQQIDEYQDKLQSNNAGLMEYEAKVKEMASKLVGYEEKMKITEQAELYKQQVEVYRQQVEHERGLCAQLKSQVRSMSGSDSASEQAEIYRQQVEHERGLREQLESQVSSMSRSDRSASEQVEIYKQQVEIYKQQVEEERGVREQLESQVSRMSRSDSTVEQMSQEKMALMRRLQQEEGRRAEVEVEVGKLTQEMSDLRSRIRESEGPRASGGPGEAAADGSGSKGDFEDYNWVIDNYLFSPTKEEEGMARDSLKRKGLAIDPDKLGQLLESYHSLQKRYADLQQEASKQQAAPAPVGSDELMRSLNQQYEILESELEKQRDMQEELEVCLRILEHWQGGAPPLASSSSGSQLEELLSQEESRRLAEEAKVQVLTHQVEELQAKSVSKLDFEDQLVTVGALALAQMIMLSYGFGVWFEMMLIPLFGPFPT